MGHQCTYWRSRAIRAIFRFWKYFSGSGKAPSRSGNTPKVQEKSPTRRTAYRPSWFEEHKPHTPIHAFTIQSMSLLMPNCCPIESFCFRFRCRLLIWAMGRAQRPGRRLIRRGLPPRAPPGVLLLHSAPIFGPLGGA